MVVVGGDNGWEVSFDGNVNGFYLYEDAEATPGNASPSAPSGRTTVRRTVYSAETNVVNFAGELTFEDASEVVTNTRQGTLAITGSNTRSSRVRTGLLPGFFSFNVRSPEVGGLRGSARISFARRSRCQHEEPVRRPDRLPVKCSSTWTAILAPGA